MVSRQESNESDRTLVDIATQQRRLAPLPPEPSHPQSRSPTIISPAVPSSSPGAERGAFQVPRKPITTIPPVARSDEVPPYSSPQNSGESWTQQQQQHLNQRNDIPRPADEEQQHLARRRRLHQSRVHYEDGPHPDEATYPATRPLRIQRRSNGNGGTTTAHQHHQSIPNRRQSSHIQHHEPGNLSTFGHRHISITASPTFEQLNNFSRSRHNTLVGGMNPTRSYFSPTSSQPTPYSGFGSFRSSQEGGGGAAPNFEDLFFDLLFVANLTVYSNSAQLSSLGEVGGFLGYFALLWWTWYSHCLFDVRFRTRPGLVKSRLVFYPQYCTRLCTIGVWVAFTTTAGQFSRGDFVSFSEIYALNRLVLGLDYFIIAVDQFRRDGWRQFLEPEEDEGAESTPTRLSSWMRGCGPMVGLASTWGSAFIWFMSSRLPNEPRWMNARFGIWICATIWSLSCLLIAEWKTRMISLRNTQLCERLALFAIVILGDGFSQVGAVLNSLSPGLKVHAMNHTGLVPSDGWDFDVVMQTTATVLILCFAFVTYYRDAQLELRNSRSLVILGWSFLHVVYFAAAALLVVGLKKLIGFHSVIAAFVRFIHHPEHFLPDTPKYHNVTGEYITELLSRRDISPVRQANGSNTTSPAQPRAPLDLNATDVQILAIVSVIEGFFGASIPSVPQALALVKSAGPLIEVDTGPALKSLLPGMQGYIGQLKSVHSLNAFVLKGLFQYKYVYLSAAVIYIFDCFIKGIQAGRKNFRSRMPALLIRFCTGLLLCGIQICYYAYHIVPSWASLNGGVPILATIMAVEILTQILVGWYLDRLALQKFEKDQAAAEGQYLQQQGKGTMNAPPLGGPRPPTAA